MADEPGGAAGSLAARIEALLGEAGGRTALAAQWFAPAGGVPVSPAPDARALALRADEPFPSASLIKLAISVEVMRRVDLGAYALDERFDVAAEPRAGGGSLLDYLDVGWRPTLADLCALMLAVSDNTAANVLLDLVGMGEVNETMARLGLAQTRLARRFMDLAARAAGRDNLTSAGDMAKLLGLLRGSALPGAARIRALMMHDPHFEAVTFGLPVEAELTHKSGTLDDTVHGAGLMAGPRGACAYCVLTTGQRDLPLAAYTVARAVRTLWEAWCAPTG